MFSPMVRILLIFVATAGGILTLPRSPAFSGTLFLSSALVLLGYFRYGTIWLAFRALKKGRIDRVERLVKQIHLPDWLRAQERASYEMLRGTLAAEKGDLVAAEIHLRAAVAGRLRPLNNLSVANLALAEILLRRGDRESAESLLAEARAQPHRPELEPRLDQIEEQIRLS